MLLLISFPFYFLLWHAYHPSFIDIQTISQPPYLIHFIWTVLFLMSDSENVPSANNRTMCYINRALISPKALFLLLLHWTIYKMHCRASHKGSSRAPLKAVISVNWRNKGGGYIETLSTEVPLHVSHWGLGNVPCSFIVVASENWISQPNSIVRACSLQTCTGSRSFTAS